jgi:hypothetical protein
MIMKKIVILLLLIIGCIPETDICAKGGPSPNNVACVEIYQPVIAPDGTEYPNACYAERDGWDNSCLTLKEL